MSKSRPGLKTLTPLSMRVVMLPKRMEKGLDLPVGLDE